MPPIIAVTASPNRILPAMDLKLHLLDVFIQSLHSWMDSNACLAAIFMGEQHRLFPLTLLFSHDPLLEDGIGTLLLFIRHAGIELLERRDEFF